MRCVGINGTLGACVICAATSAVAQQDPNFKADIAAYCAKQWGDDFRMTEICINKQYDALGDVAQFFGKYGDSNLNLTGVPATIVSHCFRQWEKGDWAMRSICIKRQAEAAQRLGKL